jgi:hypothetical protein
MELPENLQHAISLASMRAKLLFDTYHWTWTDPHNPPTVKQIEELYIRLTTDVLAMAMEVEDGKTVNCGNMMSGRLRVELIDEHWSFGVEVAGAWNGGLNYVEKERETINVVNVAELGLIESD